MSGLFALAKPRRIKASHRRRGKVAWGPIVQRYYDPQIGRFLSVDPVTASSVTGANFNRYWYAADNPYRFTDPDGRSHLEKGNEGCDSSCWENRRRTSQQRISQIKREAAKQRHGQGSNRNQGTKDAIAAAGGANTGAATAGSIVEGSVWLTAGGGQFTSEALNALKFAKNIAKGSSLVGGALAIDEINSGSTQSDKAHGWVNLAASAAGIGCAVSGVCGAVVGGGLAIYGIADTAVQFKQYKDPITGEQFAGWQAFYKDATD